MYKNIHKLQKHNTITNTLAKIKIKIKEIKK